MRILLIDDSSAYREEFAELLAAGDFAAATLDHTLSASEGARLMNRGEHDIYFVDYRLPGTSGLELIRRARAAGSERPILCLTAFDDPRLDLEAEQAGANGYLPKGAFDAPFLSRTIRYAVRNASDMQMPRDAQTRFRLAQETANFGTWEWDIVHDELIWDERMYHLYGCEPRDGPPRAVWQRALDTDTRLAVEMIRRDSIQSGKPFQTDFRVTWPDGSTHHVRSAGRVTRGGDGTPLRLSGINMDITELRQLVAELAQARDSARRANDAKSRFLAGITHELRTPLNGILGYAHLLRLEGGLTTSQEMRVGAMLQAGAHLLDMISRVLDLSAIEAEHLELSLEDFELRQLVASCIDLVRPAASAKGLAIGLDVTGDTPLLVHSDRTRLRQIMVNLLGNAVKFTAKGAVTVSFHSVGDRTTRIEVADTGPGIPPDQRLRLFQDFERSSDSAVQAMEGAGLGLAVSSRLAKLLGGRLSYRDNPTGGSLFSLDLPLRIETPRDSALPARPGRMDAAQPGCKTTGRSLSVLVVDDVEVNLEIATAFLEVAGHRVARAHGGAEAVAAIAAGRFDVVLMDVRMPEVDGLEATRRVRALGSPGAQVPIIGLTAQAFTDQVDQCIKAGMNGHLAKPYDPESLLAAVAAAA